MDGFSDDRIELVVPRKRRSLDPSVVLHTTKQWHTEDLLRRDGVRTTSVNRTIIDLAASGHIVSSIENAPGRPGIRLLRAILLDSGGESFLERRFLRLVRDARLPRPICQVVYSTTGRVIRVDFEFRGTEVVVEVSGRFGHTSDRDRQKDARRRNALQQLGKEVLEFTTIDVLSSPDYVLETLHTSGVVTR